MPEKHVRFAEDVRDIRNARYFPRPPQNPVRNVETDVLHRTKRSIYREDYMYNKYARDKNAVHTALQKIYPPYHVWKSFRQHGEAKGLDYRKLNVEDYFLSIMGKSRDTYPPGFSLR